MSVEYNDNSIYVAPPSVNQGPELVYVRPGDVVNLEFSIESSKLEISNGDLVLSLADGRRVVLVSLVDMSFAENPPTITDSSGQEYQVSDLVTSLEVVRQTDAVLIITQIENTDKDAEEKPAVVVSASEQDGSDVSGSPTGGDGDIAYQTEGAPTDKINPLGVVPGNVPSAGLGVYPTTPNSDNQIGNSDSDSTLPGDISYTPQNSLDITYYYGDTVSWGGNVNINGTSYQSISIESGSAIRNVDPQVQILPSDIGDLSGTSASYFINARYKNDKIIRAVSIDYEGFKPISIDIKNVPADVSIETTSSAVIRKNLDGSYTISQIPPGGDLSFNIVYDAGRADEAFNMEYKVLYYDEFGEAISFNYNQNIKFRSVSDASAFQGTDIIFSTDAGGVKVTTSAGGFDDIVVGGGARNDVSVNGGSDYYFSGAGQDFVNLGDGNDFYYGNTGLDVIIGGAGVDTIRFDNFDAGLTGLDSVLYKTYVASQGLEFYMSVNQSVVGSMSTISADAKAAFVDGDSFVRTADGQVVKGVEAFYGTKFSDTFYIGMVGITSDIHVYGVDGAGTDTLSFNLSTRTTGIDLNVTSMAYASGTGTFFFYDFDVYQGTVFDDTFSSSITAGLNGITIDGGDGVDIVTYSAGTEAIVFDAANNTVSDVGATYTNKIQNIETLIGSQGDDVFKGGISTHLFYQGGAGDDELTYISAKSGISFDAVSGRIYKTSNESFLLDDLVAKNVAFDSFDSSIESLVFTKSSDIFYFSSSITGTPYFTTLDGVDGLDTVHLGGVTGATVTFDAGQLKYTHAGGGDFTFVNVERIRFGDGDDSFVVSNGFTGQSYYIIGGDGVDTLNFQAITASVAFDIGLGIATITGGSTGNVQFSGMETFIGSQGDDVFYLSNSLLDGSMDPTNYTLNGDNGFDTLSFKKVQSSTGASVIYDASSGLGSPTISYDGIDVMFNLVSIEGIEGTSYNDTFKILYNSDLTTVKSVISGGEGKDILELTVAAGESVVLDLYTGKVGGDKISGIEVFNNLSDLDDTVTMNSGNYEINAGAGSDSVDFSKVSTYVNFTFNEDGSFVAVVGSNLYSSILQGFEIVQGTNSDDVFKLSATNSSGGNLAYSIDGGLGNNKISFDNSSTAIVGFELQYNGSHVFTDATTSNTTTYNWNNIQGFIFTSLDDEIKSSSADSSFTVAGGAGNDTLDYSSITGVGITYQMAQGWVIKGAGVDRISSIEIIKATAQDDLFILTESTTPITIEAGAGNDVVNLSSITGDTVDIVFDGSSHAITAVSGATSGIINLTGVEEIFSSSANVTTFKLKEGGSYSGTYVFQSNNLYAESYVSFADLTGSVTYNLVDFSIVNTGGTSTFAADFRLQLNTITGIILTGNDDIVTGSENISIAIDGGAGNDVVNYSGFTTAVYFNLGTGEYLKINNNLQDTVKNVETIIATGNNDVFSFGEDSTQINSLGITNIDGGAGNDSVSFVDIKTDALTYTSTATDATIIVGSTSLIIGSMTSMEALIGTTNNDKFVIQGINTGATFSPANINVFDGDKGTDEVDLSSYTSNNTLTFNASGTSTIVLGGTSIEFRNMENYKLGSGNDTVVAGLNGSHNYDLGTGDNTLDYSNIPIGIAVDFDNKTITKTSTSIDRFTDLAQISTFVGSNFSDTFIVSDITLLAGLNLDGGGTNASGISTDSDTLQITSSAGVTVDLGTGLGSISSIERIKTGSGDDTFILRDVYLFQTSAGYFTNIDGGAGTDTVNYSTLTTSITYNMARNLVTRTGVGGVTVTDMLTSIENIVGSQADDVFSAYVGNITIDGNAGDDILNFSLLGFNSIDIDVNTKSISFKDLEGNSVAGRVGFSNIERITATRYDDRIDASNIPAGGFTDTILIDGGAGDDSISFFNKTSSHTLDLSAGTGINLGNVTLSSFETVQLTKFDDQVIMGLTDETRLDGGTGVDTIDFSAATESVSVSFVAGYITKSSGVDTYSNAFTNFEKIITGSGNDRFVISSDLLNSSTASSIDLNAGAGNDFLDMSNVHDISFSGSSTSILEANKLTLQYLNSSGKSSSASFNQFETYSLAVSGTLNLEIRDSGRTGDISLVTAGASDVANIVFGKAAAAAAYDVVFDAGTSIVTSGAAGGTYKVLGASSIGAKDGVGLYYYSSVVNDYDVNFSGSAAVSTVDYSKVQFASSFKISSLNSNGMNFQVVKGSTSAITASSTINETLTNVTKIVGTANADRFDLFENTTGTTFEIDLGGGSAINTVLVNSSTAINATIGATGSISITGYNITNGNYIAGLTDFDDKITITANPTNAIELMGGSGFDSIDYSAVTNNNMQIVLSRDSISALRGAGGTSLEDKLGEFEGIIASGANSANTFLFNEALAGNIAFLVDGGVADTNSAYYDVLIMTSYTNVSSQALELNVATGTISIGSGASATVIANFKNMEEIVLGAEDDTIKLYYTSAPTVGYVREISALAGNDTVQLREGFQADLSSGVFTIDNGASSSFDVSLSGVEVLDIAVGNSGAASTIYVGTSLSDTASYLFKSSTAGLTGSVYISYDNYASAVIVTDVAANNVEISTALGTAKDVIDGSLSSRVVLEGSIYDDAFYISNFTDAGGNPLSRSFLGNDGSDEITFDYSTASASITKTEITIGSKLSISNTLASSATFGQQIDGFEKIIIDAGSKKTGVIFNGSDIASVDIAIVNSSELFVDLSKLDRTHDTTISMSSKTGTDLDFGFSIYSSAISSNIEYSFQNVNEILYSSKDSSAFEWVVDDKFLNAISATAFTMPTLTYVSGGAGSLSNNLTFLSFKSMNVTVGANLDVTVTNYKDSAGVDHDVSADNIRFPSGVYNLVLTTGDDVLSGQTVGIDVSATYDLNFGNDTVEVVFSDFGSTTDTIAVNYILGKDGYVAAAHKNNTGGDFTTYLGVSVLNSYVGKDTLTLRGSDRVNITYNSGDTATIINNQATNSNIGKDEFVYTTTGTGFLGSSIFSLQYVTTSGSTYYNSVQDWGIAGQDKIRLDHLSSSILFEDVYGVNKYVLDSATGAYTIDNTLRFNTSLNSMFYLRGISGLTTGTVDVTNLASKVSAYGDPTAADLGKYKENPYIMYSEFELGGGSNNIDYEVDVRAVSNYTWDNNVTMHLVETAGGRLMLNIAIQGRNNGHIVTDAGGNASLIDTDADMARTSYATGNLMTIYADDFDNIIGPGGGQFTFATTFDAYVRANPLVSAGDNRSGLSTDQSAYSVDLVYIYDVSDKYIHAAYSGTSDGIRFSYGTTAEDVNYSQSYFFENIVELTLEIDATSTVKFTIGAQMPSASSVKRETYIALTEFSQNSVLDYGSYSYSPTATLLMEISQSASKGVKVVVDPPGPNDEKMGGYNFGTIILPEAYNRVDINFNSTNVTEGLIFETSQVDPATVYAITYTHAAGYKAVVTNVASPTTGSRSYTYVERYNDLNGNNAIDAGELVATDYYYFNTSGSTIARSTFNYVDDSMFNSSITEIAYSAGSKDLRYINNDMDYVFEGSNNNILSISSVVVGATFNLGSETTGDVVINDGITNLHIGENMGYFLDSLDVATSFGNGSEEFFIGGADFVKAGADTNYMLYSYANVNIVSTGYYETITVFDIDASYQVFGNETIEGIDYSNLGDGFTFSLSSGGGYISDNYDGSHSSRIGQVQDIRGSLGDDSFSVDDISNFSIDGSDGLDIVSIASIDNSTSAQDLADAMDNIEILEISNIEQDVFEITVEDIISMTDENNNLVIKNSDQDTILEIISSNSDYFLTTGQDSNGNDVYGIYSSSDPSNQIGEVTVVKDNSNSNNI